MASPTRSVTTTLAPTTSVSPTTSAAPIKALLGKSGVGNEALGSVVLPKGWTVSWGFECPDSKTGTFVLTETPTGAKAATVTNQTGLGGSGHKPYTASGTYSFAVKTTCGWQVKVGSTTA